MDEFLSDIQTLRARARHQIEHGPITESYVADRDRVTGVLNEDLATELVCVRRYKQHSFMAQRINASNAATEFLQHPIDEQGHADRIAAGIVQLQVCAPLRPPAGSARAATPSTLKAGTSSE